MCVQRPPDIQAAFLFAFPENRNCPVFICCMKVRPEDLEVIIIGEEKQIAAPVIVPGIQLPPTSPQETLPPAIAAPADYTAEWKQLDAKALAFFNERAQMSNSLISLQTNEQRAIAYAQIVGKTKEYNQLQLQKKALERGEQLPVIQEAIEKDYSGYTQLQLHKEIENIRSKRSKRKKSLENPESLKPRLVQKYQAEIKTYDSEIERLEKLKSNG